jgi:flagellar hook-associated protein FlgK
MASIYGIGISALGAAQSGVLTAEHNIANVNTEGYRRQQTVQATNTPQFTGAGFIGNGVNVSDVRRIFSQFLDNQVLQAETQQNQLQAYFDQISQIDNMLADQASGLSPALATFFQGVSEVAANPGSVPARQSMIGTAQALVSRVHALDGRFRDLRSGINTQLTGMVQEINSFATEIAAMNKQISVAESSAYNHQANDLRDQRDTLVSELNKLVKTSVVTQSDGSYNVFIGNGQALVVGQNTYQLAARQSLEDQEQLDLFYQTSPGSTNYVAIKSTLLTGGELGGLLAFRSESLDAAQNALGRISMAIGQTFNDQHRLGTDLNGLAGGDFFTIGQPSVLPRTQQPPVAGTVTATIADVGALTTSDYSLTFNGGSSYTLVRLSDNKITPIDTTASNVVTVDGLTLNLGGAPNANDRWLIRPTRNGARDMAVSLTDTSRIAAAAPMRTEAAAANTGSGVISLGSVVAPQGNVTITFTSGTTYTVTDNTTGAVTPFGALPANGVFQYPAGTGWPVNITGAVAGDSFVINKAAITATPSTAATKIDPTVDNNVTINFTSATTFDVLDTTTNLGPPVGNPTILASGVPYNPGAPLNYNGWTAQLTGAPATGDSFTVAPNTNGTVDNRNALELAGLQTRNTMVNGNDGAGAPTTTYLGAYSQLVSSVGNKTREIQVTNTAQQALVAQVRQSQQSLSGVNLDEEAANLIRYQQAYQAAGKMIQVATTLFDTLLTLGNG